ncbi:MAG: NTP transferase domain-containing protein [Spirochaetota bacterium]
MRDRTVVVLAARINSRRLPRKMLLPINRRPLIEMLIRRLKRSKEVDEIVLATTRATYPHVRDVIERMGISFFIGSETDVLGRYYRAAKRAHAGIVVRATGDNPLVSPEAIDMIVRYHRRHHPDLSHYLGLPLGTGVEVISFPALARAHREAKDAFSREHITQHMYRNRDRYSVREPRAPRRFCRDDLSLTVDTENDYRTVSRIFRHFGADSESVGVDRIIRYVERTERSLIERRYYKRIDNMRVLC